MAVGDGINWNEAVPDDNTVANQIDDYNRDLRLGVRSRMAREHIWGASQTATNEGGHHILVTFQAQTAAPTMAGTTAGGLYIGASSAGYPLIFINSGGTGRTVVDTTGGTALVVSTVSGIISAAAATKADSTVYQATSDGIVTAQSQGQTASKDLQGLTDTANPPTTLIARTYLPQTTGEASIASISFPVRKNYYWKVTGATSGAIYFTAIGI